MGCSDPATVCTQANRCDPCGLPGQFCCANELCTTAGARCFARPLCSPNCGTCRLCGGAGQICCPGRVCGTGLTCSGDPDGSCG
jgi:hypothetical protein